MRRCVVGEFAGLVTEQIIDCSGRMTHELTLDFDGTVTVRFGPGGRMVRLDPANRCVLTPGAQVPDQIMDLAAGLRVG